VENIRVSVVVPVYKGEKYINECVGSILSQSYRDIELILLDDGSPDNSGALCDEIAKSDKRVRVIHKKNEGINATRSQGVREAKGEWVMFVDDDDSLVPKALEKMMQLTDDTDIVIGFPDTPLHKTPLSLEECRSNIITAKLIPPTPWAKLFRRSLLTDDIFDFPREIDGEEDMIMNIRLFFKTQRTPRILFEKVYNFRRNPVSVSHTKRASLKHEELFDRVRNASIPVEELPNYMNEIIWSRLNGLHGPAISEPQKFKDNDYVIMINNDIRQSHYNLSLLDKFMLSSVPSLVRKAIGYCFMIRDFCCYHLGLNN
jgi:glycosyltransferase involved in cell wall biosynthesis